MAGVISDERKLALADWLGSVLGMSVSVSTISPLSGGAIQENWLLEITTNSGTREFVLRKDAPARIAASHTRGEEFAILRHVHAAGVLVPQPIAFCADPAILGNPFAIMAKAAGQGFGPRIVKDMSLGGDRRALTQRIGAEMARIHAIAPPQPGLGFLGPTPDDPVQAEIAWLRSALDRLGLVRPAIEWGLRFIEIHPPAHHATTLVHRDLRTGNYMVDHAGLTAILDWEFAGWGEPMSDLGWFCAACWRFGRGDLEAGGIGARADLYAGYVSAGGMPIDDVSVHLWEIMAHLRWAVIALQQGARHLSGEEPSLALALTSRIVPELELAVLRATSPESWKSRTRTLTYCDNSIIKQSYQAGETCGADLLAIAGKELAETILPRLQGDERHSGLMVASAMRIVLREIAGRSDSPRPSGQGEMHQMIRDGLGDGSPEIFRILLAETIKSVSYTKPAMLNGAELGLLG